MDATRARSNPLPFALPEQMVLGLTSQQLLIWRQVGQWFWRRPGALIGGLAFADLERVELSRSRGMLSFGLVKGSFEIAVHDLDDARTFVAALREALARPR